MEKDKIFSILGNLVVKLIDSSVSAIERGKIAHDIHKIQKVLDDFDHITNDTARQRVEDAQNRVGDWWKKAQGR